MNLGSGNKEPAPAFALCFGKPLKTTVEWTRSRLNPLMKCSKWKCGDSSRIRSETETVQMLNDQKQK